MYSHSHAHKFLLNINTHGIMFNVYYSERWNTEQILCWLIYRIAFTILLSIGRVFNTLFKSMYLLLPLLSIKFSHDFHCFIFRFDSIQLFIEWMNTVCFFSIICYCSFNRLTYFLCITTFKLESSEFKHIIVNHVKNYSVTMNKFL